jgi:dipeptidyl aminopeptidase/acylaminoacyl peptidase
MFRLLSIVAGAAVLLSAAPAPAPAAPLEAYGKLPSIEQAALSPSGKRLAVITTNGEQRAIVVKDLATDSVVMRADTGAAKVRAIRWAAEDDLIIVSSQTTSLRESASTRAEWLKAFVLDLPSRKLTQLSYEGPNRGVRAGGTYILDTVSGIPTVRVVGGKPTIFFLGRLWQDGQFRLTLFKAPADGRTPGVVEVGQFDTIDFTIGLDGQVAAQESYDDRTGRWSLKIRQGGGWRTVREVVAPTNPPSLLGLGRDGRSVIFEEYDADKARNVWREVSLADGAIRDGGDARDGLLRDPQDGRLVGTYELVGDDGRYLFLDEGDARTWRSVAAAFPDSIVNLESWTGDRRKILVSADSPTEGPGYALVDLDAKSADWIGQSYLDLQADDVHPRKPVRFKAADGLQLSGYLTLPKGREPKGLPLIVFPHGGPASRDTPGFDWWAQAMAARGYAVLQVNFRGSDGFGPAHLAAGYGQWGRKMQTDLSDGVRWLAGQGTIDAKRVCIVGASYGGYAALAGPTLDPGVYRCAVSVAGVADLRRMVNWSGDNRGQAAYRYWTRFMGADNAGDPRLAEISPAAQAARADAPILLVHGRDDTVVPLEQSQVMADALKRAGKPHELLVMRGEDHWLSRGATRQEMLQATMAFVEKHNPPH